MALGILLRPRQPSVKSGRSVEDEATLLINADGTYEDGNAAALAILGMTREELRGLPSQALSMENDRAQAEEVQTSWEGSGSDPLIGQGTVRRPDGVPVRVRFLLVPRKDGRFVAVLRPSSEAVERAASWFTTGQILSTWRAAERRLEAVVDGSAEWDAIQIEIAAFREQYQRLFAAESDRPSEGSTTS
jgi:PAS domain S-box-containing protein